MVSSETLHLLLRYEPETGRLFWRERPHSLFRTPGREIQWNRRWAAAEAFTAINSAGYRFGRIEGRQVHAHRVIWAMMRGEWPEQVDHINGDRLDNRLQNLRSVSHAENVKNACRRHDNKSGVTGVTWDSAAGRWRASIKSNRRFRSLGYFDTIEEAAVAREAAQREMGFHLNHGRERHASGS